MPELPVACTLDPAALTTRQRDLPGALIGRAVERLDIPNGCRLRFVPGDGILTGSVTVIENNGGAAGF